MQRSSRLGFSGPSFWEDSNQLKSRIEREARSLPVGAQNLGAHPPDRSCALVATNRRLGTDRCDAPAGFLKERDKRGAQFLGVGRVSR